MKKTVIKIWGKKQTTLIRVDPRYWRIVEREYPRDKNPERLRKLVNELINGKGKKK